MIVVRVDGVDAKGDPAGLEAKKLKAVAKTGCAPVLVAVLVVLTTLIYALTRIP